MSGKVAGPAPQRIVIASRESALAMWQARHVQERLAGLYPRAEVTVLGVTTEGDRRLDAPLARIGGKGLFIKELEDALASGRADIAVHSMKDVPMRLPAGFALAAVMEREDPRDAFVSNRYPGLGAMPSGARVGAAAGEAVDYAVRMRRFDPDATLDRMAARIAVTGRLIDRLALVVSAN